MLVIDGIGHLSYHCRSSLPRDWQYVHRPSLVDGDGGLSGAGRIRAQVCVMSMHVPVERRTGSTCILPSMDSLAAAAARALAVGDPLGALKHVALRDDAPALALRGIAMAQLGDYDRARKLLRRAARGFGTRERLAQARCQVAEAEVALAARDLSGPGRALDAAPRVLDALGDRANALFARLVGARRQVLVGDLTAAERTLAVVDTAGAPPPLAARAELTRAELALRRVRAADAAAATGRAHVAAHAAGIPALVAEVDRARRALSAPSARLICGGAVRPVRLDEVEALFASDGLAVAAARRA